MTLALVLAAGAASRMGAPKQAMFFCGKPLVVHAVEQAQAAGLEPLVVTGAHAHAVQAALAGLAPTVHNPDWELGMGSSITAGMRAATDAAAVAILLADQPLVEARHLNSMHTRLAATDADMVAAAFHGTLGAPVFFKRSMFDTLRSLPQSAGAKYLLSDPNFLVEAFTLSEAACDVDRPEDFASLEKRASGID